MFELVRVRYSAVLIDGRVKSIPKRLKFSYFAFKFLKNQLWQLWCNVVLSECCRPEAVFALL